MKPVSMVTGGAGFIGSHVAEHCLKLGHDVVVMDDLSGGFRNNVPEEAIFVHNSITDSDVVDGLFYAFHPDYVYHCAAYAAENLSHYIRKFNYENNLIGSVNLINASIRHNVKCFVFTSSIAVYGSAPSPMRELMRPIPDDPYGVAKYAVELDLRTSFVRFGLPYIVFRPHNVYGERQNLADPFRNVVGIWMNQIMHDQPCTIFGDGMQQRAFTHVDDVAPIISRSVTVPDAYNDVYNIGISQSCTVQELCYLVRRAMNKDTGIVNLPPRPETFEARADHTKCNQMFGSPAKIELEEGLARMAAWAMSSGEHIKTSVPDLEVDRSFDLWYPSAQEIHG